MLLKDKVVIVSGIGPGLGLEVARLAAQEGAKVAIGARTVPFLEKTAKEIADAGGDAIWKRTDLSQRADCFALVQAAVDKWGSVHALVNNGAKVEPYSMFEEADFDEWRGIHNVNLFGSMTMAQACVPHMKKVGKGYIVNVSSIAHRKPQLTMGAYATSKAALEGATRQMALELGPMGIRVNTARMGWMDGPTIADFLGKMAEAQGVDIKVMKAPIEQNIPLGVIPDDEDCARAVLFLCTSWCDAVTGCVLDINGGEIMS